MYRLIPLMFIKEENIKAQKPLDDINKTIKVMRDSFAHNNIKANNEGFTFKGNKIEIKMTYEEFNEFLYKVENNYANESYQTPK